MATGVRRLGLADDEVFLKVVPARYYPQHHPHAFQTLNS